MQILTANINKGGTGKTTFIYNFVYYLVKNYMAKVLVLDIDDSRNLTNLYENKYPEQFEQIKKENTVLQLFDTEAQNDFKPIELTDNIHLIAGDKELENFKKLLITKLNREKILMSWIEKNFDALDEKYDYIIIDSENSKDDVVINALLISDLVVGVAQASDNSIDAIIDLQEFINQLNKGFSTNINYKIIGNQIDTRETASKELIEALSLVEGIKENYLGYIPRKAALQSSDTIYEAPRKRDNLDSIIHINKLFKSIKEILDAA